MQTTYQSASAGGPTRRWSVAGLLAVLTFAAASVGSAATTYRETTLVAADGAAEDEYGHAVDVDRGSVVIGARYDDNTNGANAGAVYVATPNESGGYTQDKLVASDGAAGDLFGTSVATDGDTTVVGAPYDDNGNGADAGAVYVFTRTEAGGYTRDKLLAFDGASNDGFGFAVAVDDGIVVVGAPSDDNPKGTDAGAAYVFTPDGSGHDEDKLLAHDTTSDRLGISVAIDRGTVAVGAPFDDNSYGTDAGAVYIFTAAGATSPLPDKLVALDGDGGDAFGWTVAIDRGTAAVGAWLDDNGHGIDAGAVYVFRPDGDGGHDEEKLRVSDLDPSDRFGFSVAVDRGTVVAAAPFRTVGDPPRSGAVFVFAPAEGDDYTETRLIAANGGFADWLGFALAAEDGTIAAGAPLADGQGSSSGSVSVFVDVTPPTTAIDEGPVGTRATRHATFRFSADEPAVRFQCRLDGAAWSACTSPHGVTGLSEGEHVFDVRAIDPAGNIDRTPATRAWTVDSIPDRLAGPDRYATAVAIGLHQFPDGANTVFLARADNVVDAVAGGALTDGPVLLVNSCGPLPGVVTDALTTLAPSQVTALGGTTAICNDTLVEAATHAGAVVGRLAGPDRYATAVAIGLHQFPNGANTVFLARADNVVDAVAGGALTDGPVLLVNSCGPLPGVVTDALTTLAPSQVTALGGTTAICNDTLASAGAHASAGTDRLAGPDRHATAVAIGLHQFPDGANTVFLARADNVVDAVAGGALTDGPVLLVNSCGPLPGVVTDALTTLAPSQVTALGGTTAICNDTLAQAQE